MKIVILTLDRLDIRQTKEKCTSIHEDMMVYIDDDRMNLEIEVHVYPCISICISI